MSDNETPIVNEESPSRRDVIKSMYNDYFLDYVSYVILEEQYHLPRMDSNLFNAVFFTRCSIWMMGGTTK